MWISNINISSQIPCILYRGIFLCLILLVLAGVGCTKAPPVIEKAPPKPEVKLPPPPEPEPTPYERWQALVKRKQYATLNDKLASVNTFFNELDYIDDQFLWGKEDYWATLYETLIKRGGDCEDFTIAKYFTLKRLNIPEEKMRITYVYSLKTKQPHMVLTLNVSHGDEPLVLDTMNNYLFPVSRRPDLVPVYSFNSNGYWLSKKDKNWKGARLGSAKKLSLWWDLLTRMRRSEELGPEVGRVYLDGKAAKLSNYLTGY